MERTRRQNYLVKKYAMYKEAALERSIGHKKVADECIGIKRKAGHIEAPSYLYFECNNK